MAKHIFRRDFIVLVCEVLKRILYVLLAVMIFTGGFVVFSETQTAHRYERRELSGYRAFLMVGRYASSSISHSYIRITDDVLVEYPRLADAFVVERTGHSMGSGSWEWVQSTEEEGLELLELIDRLPKEGEGSVNLLYRGV